MEFPKLTFNRFGLHKNLKIIVFQCQRLGLNEINFMILMENLEVNKVIEELNFSKNSIARHVYNMFYLNIFISQNKSQKKLNLSWNEFGIGSSDYSMKCFFSSIEKNKNIVDLNLGFNRIGETVEEINLLCKSFQKNTMLEKVFLKRIHVCDLTLFETII